MRAIRLVKLAADDDDLKNSLILDEKTPAPNQDDPNLIVVRLHGASVNPIDTKRITGRLNQPHPLPYTPGLDYAGTIVSMGKNCPPSIANAFKVGDHVYGKQPVNLVSTWAEYLAIDVRTDPNPLWVKKPANVTFAEAASIPLAGLTSYQALVDHGKLGAGQKVLVVGASGGTGTYAIQIAKNLGATTIAASCSQRNADLVTELGATTVIDYNQKQWHEELKGQNFDVVYDCMGGYETWKNAQQVLKPNGGHFVTIVGDYNHSKINWMGLVAGLINRKFWSIFGYPSYSIFMLDGKRVDQLNVLNGWLENGRLRPVVERVYPMEEYLAFVKHSTSGRTRGKISLGLSPHANDKNV